MKEQIKTSAPAPRKKLFCKLPFSRISIDDQGRVWPACCPEWVAFPMGNIFEQTWEEIWFGEAAKKFREASYDGSLRYCNRDWCPYVADAEAGIENYHVIPLENSPTSWDSQPPIHVNLNYDLTCNLKCPSCRSDYIHETGENLKRNEHIQDYVEKQILPTVESVALTGVGDPFMSKVFRNFLFNFDAKKYPGIKRIHFHTNGLLFDEKTYSQMPGIHHLQLSTDISIDAADAEVYSKVRPPGKWETLMKNLEFIKKLPNLVELGISMVVQPDNYKQMLAFVELGESLVYNNRPTFVEFKRPRQYLHLTNEEYKKYNLDDLTPEMKKEFIKRLQLIEVKRLYHARKNILPAIHHNLHEYLTAAKPTTSLGRLSSKIYSLPPVSALSWKLMRSN